MQNRMLDRRQERLPNRILQDSILQDRILNKMQNRILNKMQDRMLDRIQDTIQDRILDRMKDGTSRDRCCRQDAEQDVGHDTSIFSK